MNVDSLSIVICTYNRATLLECTLARLLMLESMDDCAIDIVVVDNNSNDRTREAVETAAVNARFPVTYLREARQGKSFALNLALEHAHGDVIALTDDDVLPELDWARRIVQTFRERDVTFVFGKVLPRWACLPPPEMLTRKAQDVWGPLAIVDYGDEPTPYVKESLKQRLPIGANLAFQRSALVTIGGWRTDLGKVNNTLISGEDHEIFIRLRRFGLYSGWYDPLNAVRHYVPESRLTRRYFRRWFYWNGRTQALMLDDLFHDLDLKRVPSIAGVPRFLYREALEQIVKWLRALGSRDALRLLVEELRTLRFVGLFLGCWRRRTT